MHFSFAPMEGVTSCVYRRIHRQFFTGVDRYCAPFLAPDGSGKVKLSALRDLTPERNPQGLPLPQILCNSSEAFLALSRELDAMGYEEINLNAGCPSGTVVPKHKGAGMLLDLRSLDNFLADVFSRCPLRVSVKSRLGVESTSEFPAILDIFNKYPLAELILHARDRAGMYKSRPDLPAFGAALSASRANVCYNGNILGPDTYNTVMSTFPALDRMMIGRGAVANPALFRQLKGGTILDAAELRAFLEALCAALMDDGLQERFVLGRMKEVWYYVNYMFPGSTREMKALNKAASLSDYRAAMGAVFASGFFDPHAAFPGMLTK